MISSEFCSTIFGGERAVRRWVELAKRVNVVRLRGRIRNNILSLLLYYQSVVEAKYFSVKARDCCSTCVPLVISVIGVVLWLLLNTIINNLFFVGRSRKTFICWQINSYVAERLLNRLPRNTRKMLTVSECAYFPYPH